MEEEEEEEERWDVVESKFFRSSTQYQIKPLTFKATPSWYLDTDTEIPLKIYITVQLIIDNGEKVNPSLFKYPATGSKQKKDGFFVVIFSLYTLTLFISTKDA